MASTVTNLAQLLLNAAKLYPTASAIVTGSEQITYEEVAEQIRRLAAGYQHLNLKPGDRVGILLYNTPGFIISYFALLGLGITVLTLSTRLKASELDTVLSDAQVSWLITDTSFLPVTQDLQVTSLQGILFESNELSVLANALPSHTLNVLMEHPPVPAEDFPIPVTDKTLATLIYTSGTTGKPKGVMLSHQNLWADANANCQVIEASEQDVFITISPLFHVFGQTNVLLTAVMSGAKLVLIPKFSPKAVLSAIETHQVTFMAAVPTMYQMMLSQLKDRPYNLSSLRVCHSGAAPMPKTVFQQIEQIFDAPVQEGYGLSEASSIITSNPLHGVRKPGSIGYGLPGITVKVMDDTMQETEPGEIGEIHARGPTVMLGYWQNPDATEKRLINGWLKTGDLAAASVNQIILPVHNEDGYLFIVDRQDDLINTGGSKVYPREVEEVLYQHPAVQAVAVVGKASELYHQEVMAFIVLNDNIDGDKKQKELLLKHCRQHLADYKVPRQIEFMQDIPKGPTGKILRKQLL